MAKEGLGFRHGFEGLDGTAGTVPYYQKTELHPIATVCHSEILGEHLAFSMVYFFKMQK